MAAFEPLFCGILGECSTTMLEPQNPIGLECSTHFLQIEGLNLAAETGSQKMVKKMS